jgi:hypothetical protein
MHPTIVFDRLSLSMASGRRPRRRLTPAVRPLEGRQLLSASPAGGLDPSATMTQTATFPNLESQPNMATQAFLYFSAPLGTLTEVDVVTSGSFSTDFHAENLGPSSSTIAGTTSGNLSINVPTGSIPVTIPSVSETFNAAAFDGTLNDTGPSGKDFAPVTSSSAPQTTVLTSPADLAAFTGNFRIPITVSGHATGSATSSNDDLSFGFNTQTSATITIIYHYTPNLPSPNPPPSTSPTNPVGATPTGTGSPVQTTPTPVHNLSTHGKKKGPVHKATSSAKGAHHPLSGRPKPKTAGHSRGPQD